jgi:hypothetical protein
MASGFLKEISALIRNSNAAQVASRLSLISSDSPKRSFLDILATKSYQVNRDYTAARILLEMLTPDLRLVWQNVNELCQMSGLK